MGKTGYFRIEFDDDIGAQDQACSGDHYRRSRLSWPASKSID
jgi:hypothetical protein